MLNSEKRLDPAQPTHNPPILSFARRLETLYQQADSFDFLSWGSEISALEDEISANPATSLPEAAVQIMLASAYLERVREELVDDTDQILLKMERLIRSALSAMVRETGVDLAEFAGDRYAPDYTDPFHRSATWN